MDQAIANWRSFVAASQSWRGGCASRVLSKLPEKDEPTPLPAPARDLQGKPFPAALGHKRILIGNVSFVVKAGSAVA